MTIPAVVPRASWIQSTSTPSWFDWRNSVSNPISLPSFAQEASMSDRVVAP